MTRPSYLFPARVKMAVLHQHQSLRELLQAALDATREALCGRCEREVMAERIRELDARFRAHLEFEESALTPIVAADESWGPERAGAMLEEHQRQRQEMTALSDGIEEDWDAARLALALRSLSVDLLRDMCEEEAGRLSDPILLEPILEVSPGRFS
jgi:hypothetical protein